MELVPARIQKTLLNHRVEHSWSRSSDPCLTPHRVLATYPDADSHPRINARFGDSALRAPHVISANPVFVTWNRRDDFRQIDLIAKPVTSRQCHWVAHRLIPSGFSSFGALHLKRDSMLSRITSPTVGDQRPVPGILESRFLSPLFDRQPGRICNG